MTCEIYQKTCNENLNESHLFQKLRSIFITSFIAICMKIGFYEILYQYTSRGIVTEIYIKKLESTSLRLVVSIIEASLCKSRKDF